jgi:hypothetical protein
MRVNSKVYEQSLNAFGNIKIPNCSPAELKNVAENIMDMLADLDYSIGVYHSTGELARKITVDYWVKYDQPKLVNGWGEFKEWYLHATKSATIERAVRWLTSHNYLILPQSIIEDAYEKEENFRKAVKGK